MFKKSLLFVVLALVLALGAIAPVSAQETLAEPARVRVAHFAVDAPAVDVFVNGEAALEGVAYPAISRYLSVEAGDYEIAVAPAGAGIEAAVIGPVTLSFEAGHDYTVAATGQLADESFGPLVIDETVAFMGEMMDEATEATEEADMAEEMMEPMAKVLVLHGISNAPAVDVVLEDGTVLIAGAQFNQFATLEVPAGEYPLAVTVSGDMESVVFNLNPTTLEANRLYFLAAIGNLESGFELFAEVTGIYSIAEIAIDAGSFNTLVAAVTAADLAGTLADDAAGPYTVFAPTDEAFAALLAELGVSAEALLAREDLAAILLYHVVDGVALAEDVVGLEAVTTFQGSDISVTVTDAGVFLNERIQVIITDLLATNGVIHVIDAVLLPPAE